MANPYRGCSRLAAEWRPAMQESNRPYRLLRSRLRLCGCLVAAALIAPARAENWPSWRGAEGIGVSRDSNLPTRWSRTENVAWRVPLGEPGNSTPIVWGDRIFLTQARAKENRRTVMCLDRATGKLRWQSGITYTGEDPTHRTNPHGSGSPVTDGRSVFAWFGSAGMVAYDFDGRELWRRDLGRQRHVWGYGASPVLYRDLVIQNFGPGEPSFLIALDKKTGKTVWKVDLLARKPSAEANEAGVDGRGPKVGVAGNSGAMWDDYFGSWSTPLVIRDAGRAAGRDELVLLAPQRVVAFDPATGRELWSCRGLGDLVYTSPMHAGGIVVALGSFGGASLAVRAGGSGDVTATHRLWHTPRSKMWLGTGVIRDGHIYVADLGGVAQCLELETGKVVWTERLRGNAAAGTTWSSVVLNGERLYLLNQAGETFVWLARPRFELLGMNALEEVTNSSIVTAPGEIFIRTHDSLWKIASRGN